MSERLLRRVFNADVLGLILVFVALQALLRGVEVVIRAANLDQMFWVGLAAATIGFLAGRSRIHAARASAAIAGLGMIFVWILGSRIAVPFLELIRSLIAAGPQVFPVIGYRFDVDTGPILTAWNTIAVSSTSLVERWQIWLAGRLGDAQVNDALVRSMLWTFALWLLSSWIGWFAARRNAIAGLLPGAALLTIISYNTDRRPETLWTTILIMLLLMGLWNYKKLVSSWESRQVDYSDSIRYDNTQSVLIVAAVVGALAFITPSISWRDVRDYLRELERERERQVQSTSPTARPNIELPPAAPEVRPSLPREHLLTAGYAQSETIVMTIKTGELPPVVIENITTNAPRYYWRSVVYDQYGGSGWYTTSAPAQPIAVQEPMIAGVLSGYKLLHLNVHMQRPEGRLYWSGMLYSADIPLQVDWRLRPESNLFADQTALLQADMFAARTDATEYKADAFVPIPSVEQLRAASSEYPEQIQDRYLSLPGALPERVRRLALEITADKPSPYDKVKAVETYLRTTYPYDLEIDAPPTDQDVADYFLFDLKRGYCDYYATAMVVLVRASGIPARFVSGYSSGEYDAPNAQYVIRERHAHSWAEVYFPEIGWVEFEPTGREPEIERLESTVTSVPAEETDTAARELLFRLTNLNIYPFLIPIVILLFVVLLYFMVIEPFLFLRIAPPLAIEILYKRLYRSGRPLVGQAVRAETAFEFKNRLVQQVQNIHAHFRYNGLSRTPGKDIEQLTSLYQASLFGRHTVGPHEVRHALKLWNRLRWSLIVERIRLFIWTRNKAAR